MGGSYAFALFTVDYSCRSRRWDCRPFAAVCGKQRSPTIAPRSAANRLQLHDLEFQPDTRLGGAQLRRGGVVRTIALHPRNSSEFTVSTNSGLFRSTDGGRTWRHLDGLPTHYTVSVAYNPNDPRMLIATTQEDFHTTSFAGVWVSRDGGETWSQPETGRLTEAGGCAYRSAAFTISFDPSLSRRIFVATNSGIMISEDTGATWRLVVPGAGDARFAAVLALRGNRIIAGGQRGIWYSPDGGGSWTQESSGVPAINVNHIARFYGLAVP